VRNLGCGVLIDLVFLRLHGTKGEIERFLVENRFTNNFALPRLVIGCLQIDLYGPRSQRT
jgi:hypothetical protein